MITDNICIEKLKEEAEIIRKKRDEYLIERGIRPIELFTDFNLFINVREDIRKTLHDYTDSIRYIEYKINKMLKEQTKWTN